MKRKIDVKNEDIIKNDTRVKGFFGSINSIKYYCGESVSIPLSLVCYLRGSELRILCIILYLFNKNGVCVVSVDRIAKMLGKTKASIYATINNLIRMGLLVKNEENSKEKAICFDIATILDDIAKTRKPGVLPALRGSIKDTNPKNISRNDLLMLDKYEYKDDVEEEEYV